MKSSPRASSPSVSILGLYAGRIRPMPGDGRPTAIFKQPVMERVRIAWDGMEVDVQADRRHHGGTEKALHHYPLENHRRLARQFPELAEQFVAGAIGENISTEGYDEASICLGDVYACGSARIQVSQPRTPCWKIDSKFGREGISAYVAEQGISGWYYRVLAPGEAQAGDAFTLLERNEDAVSLAQFWEASRTRRPALEDLQRIADTPGLTEAWRQKLRQRVEWLRANA
ncbi:MOSC domain-containing protein [Nevskia soli]|uniref:MOSC domain-containing protein n=1 Tax=Nevskia soli TaxID=418856 RepID=UPI0004A7578D|nr:MOSC domain-containing protein [Nevskia soli]